MTEKIVFVYGWVIFWWCSTWRIHPIVGASALYALGHWLFVAALSSLQYLYQRELVGPMRWVKVFLLFWSVIRIWKATRLQFDRLFHVQNSTLFDDMHRKPIDCERWNEAAISCRTQLFNGFWIIINRRIHFPTIACPCMSTELFFLPYGQLCTVLRFEKNIVHLAQRLHYEKIWVLREDSVLRLLRLCVRLLQPLGSLASQVNQSTLFKCDRHSSALSSTVGSAILYAFIVESRVLICSKRDDRFLNLVMEQRGS